MSSAFRTAFEGLNNHANLDRLGCPATAPRVATVDTGLAYIVARDTQLDASIGTGVLGAAAPHPFWSVGVSQRF